MITSTIEKTIRAEYVAGKTQAQVGRLLGISYAYVNLLLSGKRDWGGLTLAKIDCAWPRAVLWLNGEPPVPPPPVAQTAHHAHTISQSVGGDAGRLNAVRAIVGASTLFRAVAAPRAPRAAYQYPHGPPARKHPA